MAKKGTHFLNEPSNLSHQLTKFLSPVKSRTIAVRLVSMALTGYYKTLVRPRTHRPLSMLKYDPVGMFNLEFVRSATLENSIWRVSAMGSMRTVNLHNLHVDVRGPDVELQAVAVPCLIYSA